MSTADAAARLGVSSQRVRQLWRDGALTGDKVANRLLLDRAAVLDLAGRVRPSTRPLSPRNAWTLLMMLAAEPAPWASPPELARLRRLAFTREVPALAELVRSRARTLQFAGPPGVGAHLLESPQLVRAGISAAARWTDLAASSEHEVYGTASAAQAVVQQWHLWPDPQGTVIVHTIPESIAQVVDGRREMPPSVVAVDLLDRGEPRSVRAGAVLWDEVVQRWRQQAPPLHGGERLTHD